MRDSCRDRKNTRPEDANKKKGLIATLECEIIGDNKRISHRRLASMPPKLGLRVRRFPN